jgi:hypothetical protein
MEQKESPFQTCIRIRLKVPQPCGFGFTTVDVNLIFRVICEIFLIILYRIVSFKLIIFSYINILSSCKNYYFAFSL